MNVMQVQKMLDQMMTQMDTGMRTGMEQGLQQSLRAKTPTDAQKAQMAELQKKISGDDQRRTVVRENERHLPAGLSRDFHPGRSQQHHRLLQFARRRAMVEKVPVAMQKAGTLMQGRIGPMTQKIQGMMEQFQKDVEKAK